MKNMYEIIEALCKEHGIKIATLSREAGISKSTLSELKMGRSQSLSAKNINKVASYFNVSIEYLLGNEQKEKPDTDSDGFTETERRDIAREVERMMADIENQGDLMFDGNPATPEALQTIRTAFEIGLTNARRLNKEKKSKEG